MNVFVSGAENLGDFFMLENLGGGVYERVFCSSGICQPSSAKGSHCSFPGPSCVGGREFVLIATWQHVVAFDNGMPKASMVASSLECLFFNKADR